MADRLAETGAAASELLICGESIQTRCSESASVEFLRGDIGKRILST